MWEEGVPLCVLRYGSEEAYQVPHTHELICEETVTPTCMEVGIKAHWKCTDCGCLYSDEGQTPITDVTTLLLPKDHVKKVIPGVKADYVHTGLTEGLACEVCGIILQEQEEVPTNGQHHFGAWQISSYPTSREPGYEVRFCRDCPADEYREYGEPLKPTVADGLPQLVLMVSFVGIPIAGFIIYRKKNKRH